mgnify:CR=1 FL=1
MSGEDGNIANKKFLEYIKKRRSEQNTDKVIEESDVSQIDLQNPIVEKKKFIAAFGSYLKNKCGDEN